MATLERPHWLLALFGVKPKVRNTLGIKEFSEAAYKASNGASPRLVSLYRAYKDSEKNSA